MSTDPAATPRVPLLVVAGLFLAALALRPQLLAIGPLLPLIREDLALSASVAGLLTTIPVLCMGVFAPIGPLVAARMGPRWVAVLGLALGAIFPLVLTLPLDVTDDPGQVGSVAALMLLGGYILSALGPFALGAARDLTGDFGASLGSSSRLP